jgi:hypothetical protein
MSKTSKIIFFLIVFLIIFSLVIYYFYYQEAFTVREIISINPILYDSSISSKDKIKDLLGLEVYDSSYNNILSATNTDPDAVIGQIKQYILVSITSNGLTPTANITNPTRGGNNNDPIISSEDTSSDVVVEKDLIPLPKK